MTNEVMFKKLICKTYPGHSDTRLKTGDLVIKCECIEVACLFIMECAIYELLVTYTFYHSF